MMKQRSITAALLLYLILGSWKGYVALFQQGQEEPRQIFPTPVSALPEADRQTLEEGIVVRSESRLQQLLEDFLS